MGCIFHLCYHSSPSKISNPSCFQGVFMPNLSPIRYLDHCIYFIRGQRVMLDSDIAKLYGVTTKNLNKAMKRNQERFPKDFMFQLSKQESNSLRFQNGTLKRGQHPKYFPYAFTQEGVAMLSGLLRSQRAVKVNIEIMRAFVRLRELITSNKYLAKKINQLEDKIETHDARFHEVLEAIRNLMDIPHKHEKTIGFRTNCSQL